MSWCPKCRNEYREGITVCAECGIKLVDSLEEHEKQAFLFGEEESGALALQADADGTEEDDADVIKEKPSYYHAYRNSADKAEDNRTSAYTLLAVGGAGFVAVILVFLGIIPLYQNSGTSRYLICGVMGALFILFIVFGIVSMRNSKILLIEAKSENSLTAEMTKWCEENLSADKVDEGLFEGAAMSEEQKYFKRAEKMRKIISDKFLNLDEAFLEHFVDEYYQKVFEKDEAQS